MLDISMLSILANELNCTIQELLNGRKMTKEELLDLRETINNLVEYESNQQIKKDKKFNKYNMISLYNRSHNISVNERKKELIKKLNKN